MTITDFNFPKDTFGYVPGAVPAKMVYSMTQPLNPVEGLWWVQTTSPSDPVESIYFYTGTEWLFFGLGAGVIVSETQPSNPRQGVRWFNPNEPVIYVWYFDGTSGQWIEETSQSTDGGIREDLKVLNSTVQIAGVQAQTLISRIEALEQRASLGALQNYTPVVLGNLTPGVGTYTSQVGIFYTLGDLVFFSASVTYTAHTGSGTLQVSLPNQAAAFDGRIALSVDYNYLNVGAGRQCVAFVTGDASSATILGADPSGGSANNVFDTAATITISGFYRRVL